jgi:paraquat-inducible protein B
VPQYHTFQVYDSKESIAQDRVYEYLEYVVLVEDSVEGLYKGAPVDYRGIRIGTVAEPFMAFDKTRAIVGSIDETRIPVILKIEPERLSQNEEVTLDVFKMMMDKWIRDGVNASLATENLLTGSLKVSLSPSNERKNSVEHFGPYPIIPFKPGAIGTLTKSMESVLNKINNLELERTVDNINDLIDRGEITLKSADAAFISAQNAIDKAGATATSLESSLVELRETLEGLQPNSQLYQSVNSSIQQLDVTLAEIKPLINDISNKPNKLLFSPTLPADREPNALPKTQGEIEKQRDEKNE